MTATLTQRDAAREKANRVRIRRAEIKRAIAAEPLLQDRYDMAAAYIVTRPPEIAGMALEDLLRPIKGYRHARQLMTKAGISTRWWPTVGELSPRQRQALLRCLGDAVGQCLTAELAQTRTSGGDDA